MKAAEIETENDLKAWLQDQPIEVAVWIAYRSAARVLPVYWSEVVPRKAGFTAIQVLRAILIAGERTLGASAEIDIAASEQAAYDASNATPPNATDPVDAAVASAASAGATAAFATKFPSESVARAAGTVHSAAASNAAARVAVTSDAVHCEVHGPDLSAPLWLDGTPDDIATLWTKTTRAISRPDGDGGDVPDYHGFWIPWCQGLLDGTDPFPARLRRAIALIDPDDWDKGDVHINNVVIPALMARHGARPAVTTDNLADGSASDIARVRSAMVRNRADLPPTFDAVLGFIMLEIERLQNRNYRDEDEAVEARRQIGVLTQLHETVTRLKSLVPNDETMPQQDAVEAEKLSRLFVARFRDWPRANADELVDTAYRGALVGAVTVALPMIGVATPYALAAGLVLFGGKKIGDAVKSARDLTRSGGGAG